MVGGGAQLKNDDGRRPIRLLPMVGRHHLVWFQFTKFAMTGIKVVEVIKLVERPQNSTIFHVVL